MDIPRDLQAAVDKLIRANGVEKTAEKLTLTEETTMRLGYGEPVRPGSIHLACRVLGLAAPKDG